MPPLATVVVSGPVVPVLPGPRVPIRGPGSAARTVHFGHLEVYAAIAAVSFLAARFAPVLGLFPACPLKAALGIPCATCGMTHAFVALAHGDAGAALSASPLGALLAASAWAFALLAAVRPILRFRWPELAPRVARAAAVAGIAALFVNWAWLIAAARVHR